MKPERAASTLQAAAELLGLALSPSQVDSLLRFARLLRERAVAAGLIGAGDEGRILSRHVIDSLRAAAVVDPTDRLGYDLGSGAGLPGIPVAVACPWLTVRLVEARRKRAAFLELAVQEIGLGNAEAVWGRAEGLREQADLCFARAFAPPERAWAAARLLLVPGGRLIHFAGAAEPPLRSLPDASSVDTRTSALLDSRGGLVIITRQ